VAPTPQSPSSGRKGWLALITALIGLVLLVGGGFMLLFGPVFGGVSEDTRWFTAPGGTQMQLDPGNYQVHEQVAPTADRNPQLHIGRDAVEITSNTGRTIEVHDIGRTAAGTTNDIHYRTQLGFTVSEAGDYHIELSPDHPVEAAITPADQTFSDPVTEFLFAVPFIGLALLLGSRAVMVRQQLDTKPSQLLRRLWRNSNDTPE
jgi:hypothetical protein